VSSFHKETDPYIHNDNGDEALRVSDSLSPHQKSEVHRPRHCRVHQRQPESISLCSLDAIYCLQPVCWSGTHQRSCQILSFLSFLCHENATVTVAFWREYGRQEWYYIPTLLLSEHKLQHLRQSTGKWLSGQRSTFCILSSISLYAWTAAEKHEVFQALVDRLRRRAVLIRWKQFASLPFLSAYGWHIVRHQELTNVDLIFLIGLNKNGEHARAIDLYIDSQVIKNTYKILANCDSLVITTSATPFRLAGLIIQRGVLCQRPWLISWTNSCTHCQASCNKLDLAKLQTNATFHKTMKQMKHQRTGNGHEAATFWQAKSINDLNMLDAAHKWVLLKKPITVSFAMLKNIKTGHYRAITHAHCQWCQHGCW